jgi:hypothetical protein
VPTLQIDHRVASFERWKEAFDAHPVGRAAGGVRTYPIARLADDPNHVVVELDFESVAQAEAFGAKHRRQWSSVGARLGLESPTARVLETVETRAS